MVLAPDQASSPKRCSGQVRLDKSWAEVGPGLAGGITCLGWPCSTLVPPPFREELDSAPGEKVARNILLNLLPPQSGIQEVGGGEGGEDGGNFNCNGHPKKCH